MKGDDVNFLVFSGITVHLFQVGTSMYAKACQLKKSNLCAIKGKGLLGSFRIKNTLFVDLS